MESISKSISTVIDERLSSPLISTFAISWSLWNYKFFVILFSNNSVLETFRLIEQVRFPDPLMWVVNGAVVPLALTALYIYALPYPSKFVYDRWSRTQKETKDIKQRWADLELLAPEDAESLRLEVREAKRRYEEAENQLERANAQQRLTDNSIRGLQAQVAKHDEIMAEKDTELLRRSHQIDTVRNEVGEARELLASALKERDTMRSRATAAENLAKRPPTPEKIKLTERQNDVLIEIADTDQMPLGHLIDFSGDRIENRHAIDVLVDRGFITLTGQDDELVVNVTKKGRAFIVESRKK